MTGADWFLAGPLAHGPLRAVVLGQDLPVVPAAAAGAGVAGVLLPDPGPAAEARLVFYAASQGWLAQDVTLQGGRRARGLLPVPQGDLTARQLAEAVATAADIMALCGVKPAEALAGRAAQMLVRGAARVRAADRSPAVRRLPAGPGDVVLARQRQPYAAFFAVEEYDLAFRRFDASLGPTVTRAVFLSGDAVTVLPYDPVRDRVLVVEQFRAGPYARGDGQPWQIEAIAGRIDPGETPEDAARREAEEEAGLRLGGLLPVAGYYPTPGICAEYLYSFVALADLPDDAAGIFGVEGEAEDIRGHLLPFDQAMGLVGTGEGANAPLILTLLWLAQERGRLREA